MPFDEAGWWFVRTCSADDDAEGEIRIHEEEVCWLVGWFLDFVWDFVGALWTTKDSTFVVF